MSFKGLSSSWDQITTSSLIKHTSQADTLSANSHTSKRPIPARINKMLQAGVLVPVHEATPWINSFVLVETRDKLGNLKLHICLDPTNLNKAIIREALSLQDA